MNPLSRSSWQRAVFFASIIGLTLMISACGGSGGSGDSSAAAASSQIGSLSLSLQWDRSSLPKAASKSQTSWTDFRTVEDVCIDYLIEEIQANVFDFSGIQVASAAWPCSAHSGLIENVPTGSGLSIEVDGFVASGLAWSGQVGNIVVNPGRITQAGTVTLRYVGDDNEPPEVVSTIPPSGDETVPLDSSIAVAFSEEMVISTMVAANFSCIEVDSQTPVSGQLVYNPATRTLIFTPQPPFNELTEYRATVASAVEDLAGHPMQEDYSWNFFTTFLDSDGDGMPDGWELAYGLNPFVDDAEEDLDEDGLSNLEEFLRGTLPNNRDSDGDGYNDGREVIQGTDPNDEASFLGIPDIEVDALKALYISTNGDNWDSNPNWMGAIGTECSWFGVTCDAAGNKVIRLNLPGNILDGPLPAAIGNLFFLERLDLGGGVESRNYLSGAIPDAIGNLANLTYLSLDRNLISGTVPPAIGGLTQLRTLDLSGNQLSGPIPAEIGALSNLEELDLSLNELTGGIPVEIANLSELRILDLRGGLRQQGEQRILGYNQLSGSIPAQMGNLAALQWLHLGYNQLGGQIPAEMGALSSLQYLDLGFNRLEGAIPPEIGNLSGLSELYLNSNQLAGEIPQNLLNLEERLATLGIGFNALYADNSEEYQALRDFLDEVAGEWTATQTTAPEGIWIEAADNTSVTLNWPAMGFSDYSGGYKVEYRKFSEGAFDRSETAVGKDNTTFTVGGLIRTPAMRSA
jgi:Leucine-rich repeat (LRR) protein